VRVQSLTRALSTVSSARFAPVCAVLAFLFLISWALAPTSVHGQQLRNIVFFGSFLGLAALGQHIVILVGGIDLSVAPVIGLSAVIFADVAQEGAGTGRIVLGAALAVGAALCAGIANGVAVTLLRITPLIATLGVGALATGGAFTVIGEGAPKTIADAVGRAVIQRPLLGTFSYVTLVWVLLALAVAAVLRWAVVGRTFVAVGANPRTARALGIHVDRYRLAGYTTAALMYGVLGLALTGLAGQPGVTLGDSYLLPSIAAVVVGGTVLGGGSGSVVATVVGAVFMTQLDSLTLSLKAPTSVQLIVQATVIAVAMALYTLRRGSLPRFLRREEAYAGETIRG
jgi:ribose transport system permease protein